MVKACPPRPVLILFLSIVTCYESLLVAVLLVSMITYSPTCIGSVGCFCVVSCLRRQWLLSVCNKYEYKISDL